MRLFNTIVFLSMIILCASSLEAKSKGHSDIKDIIQYESTLLEQAQGNNKHSMVQLGYLYLDPETELYNKDQGYAWLDKAAMIEPNFKQDLPIIKMLYQHPNEDRKIFWLIHAAKYNDKDAVNLLFNIAS